nr:reverse transcriptase domain-containing protein [Tanacetum cinerariifolium]
MEKMEALTTKINLQFKDIKGEIKEMRDGCNSYGGPHPSSKCDDKPMGVPIDEKTNYVYGGYRGGGYRGNYYEFMVAQKSSNDFVKNLFFNLKTKVEQGKRNHQATIKDLETKFGRLSDKCSSRPTGSLSSITQTNPKPNPTNDRPYLPFARNEHVNVVFTQSGLTYDPPVNPNAKTTIIYDDSEDEANEAKKEAEPIPSKQTKSDPPQLKEYKPKISYPQHLRKEKMEERYAKFIDLITEVRINVPFVDVLVGMPNYEKFLKDLVSNKSKMEQIFAAFLNEECSAIVQTSSHINWAIIIYDDSKDEADEAEKEAESISSKQTKLDPPPLKAYKPKIP